jgi:L-ribulose-5-phosphate 3-epimerase UlaE
VFGFYLVSPLLSPKATVRLSRQTAHCVALQAPEVAYRTHPRYPLGRRGPLEQVRGNAVLSTLRRLATEQGVRSRTRFGCEVETVRSGVKDDRHGAFAGQAM